jgi:serine phosphatase RsbU (regulator of sigma subunit)
VRRTVSFLPPIFALLSATLAFSPALPATAQAASASSSIARSATDPVPNTVGQSAVALSGPWKFHIGDDPRWADPDFDDSNWEPYDLAPGAGNLAPERTLQVPELPGWQQHGHPAYAGYGWYRMRLRIETGSGPISLLMPKSVEDAYEIYLDGRLIGGFGKLGGFRLTFDQHPKLFLIPDAALNPTRPITLAIRFWSLPWRALPNQQNLYGGFRGVPLMGPSPLLHVFARSVPETEPGWSIHTALFGYMVQPLLYIGIGLVSIFLFLFSKGQREYLWAGIALTGRGLLIAAIFLEEADRIPQQAGEVAQQVALWATVFSMPLAAMWLLSVPRSRWHRANILVFALFCAEGLASIGFALGWLPPNATVDLVITWLAWIPRTALSLLLLLITIDGIRTVGHKAWVLLTPGVLYAGHMFAYMFIEDLSSRLGIVDQLLSAGIPVSVLFIFLIRFKAQQRDNGRLLEDMRQAQEVQRLLIPYQAPNVPGWKIESIYRPAREVGGDFFQVLPYEDGSLLVVVGDVSGKGLQAAMTVSAIVGALRDERERRPAQVLHHLNRVLCAQISGFVTCCAAHIAEDGSMAMANAGHLAPYRNGEELPVESGLPLGVVAEFSYPESYLQLAPNDQLTFLSDGVVEAQSPTGELFGFERTRALSTQAAATIAQAAQDFGQEDDITVLTLSFVPAEVIHA